MADAPDRIPAGVPDPAAPSPGRRPRRRASLGVAVLVLGLVGLVAAWLIAPSLMIDPHRMVGWQLVGFPGRVFDRAATLTTVDVYVAVWPTEFKQGDDSWLDQRVFETPLTVTITLQASDAYEALPGHDRSWFDTGGWVEVRLLAPLGGRLLFDGSGFPPRPRG